ncbi:hypothetical protein Tco_1428932 [Tanacetum coccineum]
METKDTLFSCSVSKDQDIQRLQEKVRLSKGSCINGLRALKSNFQCLSWKYVQGVIESEFKRAFRHLFGEDVETFTRTFSQNMDTVEQQLTKETVHESNWQTTFRVLKTPFEKIFTLVLIKSSNFEGTYSRKDFQTYARMEPQLFKERILKDFDFIQKYMIESVLHDKEIEQRMNAKKLQKQGEVICIKENENSVSGNENRRSDNKSNKSGISSSISGNDMKADGADIRPTYDTNSLEQVDSDDYNVFAMEKEHPEQPESVNDTYLVEQSDTNTIPDSTDMSNNRGEADQDDDLAKEHNLLASLIEQMKLEIDGSKNINKYLESSNKTL